MSDPLLTVRSWNSSAPAVGTSGWLISTSLCATSLLGVAYAHAADNAAGTPDSGYDGDDLSEITVTGVRSVLHDKLGETPLETPQSITVIPATLIASQGSTRLEDALRNVPGITLNAGEGAARGDTINIRGFSAFNDFFIDGIRDAAVYDRDIFDADAVEVLEGPSAVLFGRGSTGGAVNQVTKAPLATAFASMSANFGTNDLLRATGDFNQPVNATTAVRLNLMGESSQAPGRDFVKSRRWGVAPAFATGIGEADSFVFTYLHQQEDNVPDSGTPFVDGRPASVPLGNDYGLASDRDTSLVDITTARYKHDFSPDVSLASTLRYAHYQFSYLEAMPNFGTTPPVADEPLSQILVGRDYPASSGIETNLDEQLDLTARFQTGFVTHTLVTGVEFSRQTVNLFNYGNPFNSSNNWVAQTPLLSPDPYEPLPAGFPAIARSSDTTAHAASFYLTDTLGLGRYWDLLLSGRFDRFQADVSQVAFSTLATTTLVHTDNVGSPRAALEFHPTPAQNYYFSFGTSFDPSAEALSLSARTSDLDPEKARTFEIGARQQVLQNLLLSAALFRTEMDNAQTNDPENPTVTLLTGDERVQGLELQASGYITQHWELFAGYTLLDGETLSSATAAYVGKEMPNVAHNQMNLWSEYELPHGLEIGGGAYWVGRRYADSGESAVVPGYVIWNTMLSWQVTPSLSVQLNGLNLFNRVYYSGVYYTSPAENHVIPGAGRSAMLSINIRL